MRKLAFLVLVACGDNAVDVEALARKTPTVDSVATAEGFTQICQGCAADLVITGDQLATTESVVLTSLATPEVYTATVTHASDHLVRAHLILPHGAATATFDVTCTGPHGSATLPDAIETTPIVVSPSASPGGKGTYQSPLLLCDPLLDQIAGTFDLVSLLAGTHTCDRVLHLAPGVFVEGSGTTTTQVIGTGSGIRFEFAGPESSTLSEVSDLSISGTTDGTSVAVSGGGLFVSAVADRGGIRVTGGQQVQISGYAFDGPGPALVIDSNTTVTISNVTIQHCSEGIVFDVTRTAGAARAFLLASNITIEQCGLAMRIGSLPQATDTDHLVEAFVSGAELVDNTRGITIEDGHSVIGQTSIRATMSGIRVENGSLSFSSSEITGHTDAGLDIDTAAVGGRGSVMLNTVTITGGQFGVRIRGFDRNTDVSISQQATIRDQTVAAVQLNGGELFQASGGVPPIALLVTSGFALDDERTAISPVADLFIVRGLTLNGTSYAGQQLTGPLSIGSDLHITSPQATWRF